MDNIVSMQYSNSFSHFFCHLLEVISPSKDIAQFFSGNEIHDDIHPLVREFLHVRSGKVQLFQLLQDFCFSSCAERAQSLIELWKPVILTETFFDDGSSVSV